MPIAYFLFRNLFCPSWKKTASRPAFSGNKYVHESNCGKLRARKRLTDTHLSTFAKIILKVYMVIVQVSVLNCMCDESSKPFTLA